jgi:hypothetical protein
MTQAFILLIMERTHAASKAGWKARLIELGGGHRVRIEFFHPVSGDKHSARGFVREQVFIEALNSLPPLCSPPYC